MGVVELYESGLSIPQVSDSTGVHRSKVRRILKLHGILRSRSDGIKIAAKHGRLGSGMRGKSNPMTDECKKKISESKTGVGRGISLKPNGYYEITMGKNKGRLEHVTIIESIIGRRLKSDECVHHIDHDKTNNEIPNLKLMKRSEHAKLHAKENEINRKRDQKGRYK